MAVASAGGGTGVFVARGGTGVFVAGAAAAAVFVGAAAAGNSLSVAIGVWAMGIAWVVVGAVLAARGRIG